MDWVDTASAFFGQGVMLSVLAFLYGVKLLSRKPKSPDLQLDITVRAIVYSLAGFVQVMIALSLSS